MNVSQPPRMATWLVQRFASGKRESLVGDLIEQYQRGRSAAWYWRQVLGAIVATAASDVGAHKVLALRALTIGWALYLVPAFPMMWLVRVVGPWIGEWLAPSGPWGVFWAGWLPPNVIIWIACAVSGWVVARLHAGHAAAMVSLYAASVFAFEYGMTSFMFLRYGFPPPHLTWEPWTMLLLPAALGMVRPLCILLGGFWSVRSGDVAGSISVF